MEHPRWPLPPVQRRLLPVPSLLKALGALQCEPIQSSADIQRLLGKTDLGSKELSVLQKCIVWDGLNIMVSLAELGSHSTPVPVIANVAHSMDPPLHRTSSRMLIDSKEEAMTNMKSHLTARTFAHGTRVTSMKADFSPPLLTSPQRHHDVLPESVDPTLLRTRRQRSEWTYKIQEELDAIPKERAIARWEEESLHHETKAEIASKDLQASAEDDAKDEKHFLTDHTLDSLMRSTHDPVFTRSDTGAENVEEEDDDDDHDDDDDDDDNDDDDDEEEEEEDDDNDEDDGENDDSGKFKDQFHGIRRSRKRISFGSTDDKESASRRSSMTWTKEEDDLLRQLMHKHSGKKWRWIASQLPRRTGKQVRQRWCEQLKDTIDHSPLSPLESLIIALKHESIGNRWAEIARILPGRTGNSVKNHWHSTLHKVVDRLIRMSIPIFDWKIDHFSNVYRKKSLRVSTDGIPERHFKELQRIHQETIQELHDRDNGAPQRKRRKGPLADSKETITFDIRTHRGEKANSPGENAPSAVDETTCTLSSSSRTPSPMLAMHADSPLKMRGFTYMSSSSPPSAFRPIPKKWHKVPEKAVELERALSN